MRGQDFSPEPRFLTRMPAVASKSMKTLLKIPFIRLDKYITTPASTGARAPAFTNPLILLRYFLILILLGAGFFYPPQAHGVKQNIRQESEETPWLGVMGEEISAQAANAIGLGEVKGIMVVDVIKGSPADEAGITVGDVILALDNTEINGYGDYLTWFKNAKGVTSVNVLINRDGNLENVFVTLQKKPEKTTAKPSGLAGAEARGNTFSARPYPCMQEGKLYAKIYNKAMRELILSEAQLKKAGPFISDYEKKTIRLTADIKTGEIELREFLTDPVDLDKVKAKINWLAAKKSELMFLRIKTLEGFKKILTDAQRKRFDEIAEAVSSEAAGSGVIDEE